MAPVLGRRNGKEELGPHRAGRVHSAEISVRGCGGWGLPQSFLFTALICLLLG